LRVLTSLIETIVNGEPGDSVIHMQERAPKKKARAKNG
jgi:hypothetical protein